jgi:two-component system, chemotaxis family, response regulator Rcp1
MKAIRVLVAEAKESNVFLVEEAPRLHNLEFQLHVAADRLTATRYTEHLGHSRQAPYPQVFLLDPNLPKVDGHDVLNTLRAHPDCSTVPAMIVTSSDAPRDRPCAELLGATPLFRQTVRFDRVSGARRSHQRADHRQALSNR